VIVYFGFGAASDRGWNILDSTIPGNWRAERRNSGALIPILSEFKGGCI
jgi:hypothetical protein